MNAGLLNRRIQIQTQSTTQDSFGAPVQTWTTVYTCWANIDIQASQLIYSTAEFVEKVTHRITLRFNKSLVLKPNERIVYTDPATGITHTYNIEAIVNPMQGNVWLTVLCYELNGAE